MWFKRGRGGVGRGFPDVGVDAIVVAPDCYAGETVDQLVEVAAGVG